MTSKKINKPNLVKPDIYGSIDIWGHILNEDIDKISNYMDETILDLENKDQEIARLEQNKVSKDEVDVIVEVKVDNYIENNVKPDLDNYLEQTTKPNLDNYLEQKKADLDKYNTEVKKPELDAYTNEKKKELDAHEKVKETELDTHTTKKEEQLDTYTTTKKEELTTHTTQKIEEVNTHVETKKTEITQHTDSEKERITQHTTAKIEEIDNHTITKKTELDTYEKEKEKQLDTYTTTKEGQLDTHTVKKQEQLDAYEKTKETELGQYAESERTSITNHTTAKIEEITQHTDSEKIKVTTHTDTEIERIKGEGTTQVSLVTDEGTKQVNLVTKEGEKQVQAVIEAGERLTLKVEDLEKNKLDKGEVSENYNTAKKIEDAIKGNKQLIDNLETGKLDKGTYNGTAQDLKDSIDNVVNLTEKTIAGKGLTQSKEDINNTINVVSEDEGIIVNDDNIKLNVVDDLITGGVKRPLSAEQGKVLKQLIDNLGTGGATQLLRNQRALGDFDYIGQLQASGKSISVGNRLYKPILYLDGIRMDKNTYTVDLTNGIITLNEVYADYEVTWVVEDDFPYHIRFSFPTLNLLINDEGIKSIIRIGDVIEIQGESDADDGGHRLVKCESEYKPDGVEIGDSKYLNEIPNTRISDKLDKEEAENTYLNKSKDSEISGTYTLHKSSPILMFKNSNLDSIRPQDKTEDAYIGFGSTSEEGKKIFQIVTRYQDLVTRIDANNLITPEKELVQALNNTYKLGLGNKGFIQSLTIEKMIKLDIGIYQSNEIEGFGKGYYTLVVLLNYDASSDRTYICFYKGSSKIYIGTTNNGRWQGWKSSWTDDNVQSWKSEDGKQGWVKYPNGVLEQWGIFKTSISSQYTLIPFHINFIKQPNFSYVYWCREAYTDMFQIHTQSLSGCTIYLPANKTLTFSQEGDGLIWNAIGFWK